MMVFITSYGKKYHTDENCVKNYEHTKISIEQAKKKGKTLCYYCENGLVNPHHKNKKNTSNKNKNNFKNHLINSNDANDIIFNGSIMKNQKIFENDFILEKSLNSINKINKIINGDISIDFNNQSNNTNNLEINENLNVNEIINENVKDSESEEEIEINENKKYKFKEEKKISEKIQENIEKDKLRGKNNNKKNEFIKNKNIIDNAFNQKEESKEDEFSFNNKSNINTLSSSHKSLCGIGDMDILKETLLEAVYISFPDQKLFNPNNNMELQNKLKKGVYKYTFEIKDLKKNHIVEIEPGFKIYYENTLDLNYRDKKLIKYQKKNLKYGTTGDKSSISKPLIFGEDTGKIFVFINVKLGKFFVIGKNELEKRINNIFLNRDNAEIFYVKNFGPLYYCRIEVEPIFIFGENTSKNCTILFNDKKINREF